MIKAVKKSLVGFSEIFAALALFGALMAACGRWHFLLDMATHFRIQVSITLLITGSCLLFLGRKYRYGSIALVVGALLSISIVTFYLPQKSPGKPTNLRVLSLNVLTSNPDKKKVTKYIRNEDADVVILSEVDDNWRNALDRALLRTYPHSKIVTRFDNFGIAVYSKLPLDPASQIKQHGRFQIPYVDLYLKPPGKAEQIRIIGMHPVPPSNALYWRSRNSQLAATAKQIASRPEIPTVVCGDLNNSPWSPFYRDFEKVSGLRNAAKGFGIHPTWTAFSFLLGLPIDHVLVSHQIHVADHRVGPDVGSDHRGIVVDLGL